MSPGSVFAGDATPQATLTSSSSSGGGGGRATLAAASRATASHARRPDWRRLAEGLAHARGLLSPRLLLDAPATLPGGCLLGPDRTNPAAKGAREEHHPGSLSPSCFQSSLEGSKFDLHPEEVALLAELGRYHLNTTISTPA